jgi:AcrR family transcriptional regulator
VTPSVSSGPSSGEEPLELRERVMHAAVRCAEEHGLRGFSIEDVAARAGTSRSSIYRHFPGGRPQLIEETAIWEIARFWGRLADAVAGLPTLEDRLVAGLVLGRKVMARSRILANLMESEFRELVAAVQPAEPLVHGVIRDYMRSMLNEEKVAGRLLPGGDPDLSADYLTRMILSWLASPSGVDVTDEDRAREVVRTQFLAGIVSPNPGS